MSAQTCIQLVQALVTTKATSPSLTESVECCPSEYHYKCSKEAQKFIKISSPSKIQGKACLG